MSAPAPEPTALQRRLATRIVQHIAEQDWRSGQPLTVVGLAELFNVSRTPVRGALGHLARQGVVRPAQRGFVVLEPGASVEEPEGPSPEEALTLHIAADYVANRLAAQVSEADLMRRYGASRALVLRVLQQLSRDAIVVRNPGHGWTFAPLLRAGAGHDESYRFRLSVEPAALVEPKFALDPAWAERSRRAHRNLLATSPKRLSMIRFFEVNADFHERLAAASGNPFFHEAVRSQNRLRRFLAYGWTYDTARVTESCAEHLAVLDAIERGDQAQAAALMRDHLTAAGEFDEPSGVTGATNRL